MPLSDDGARFTLDSILGDSKSVLWPATVYVALSKTDPVTSITEPAGAGYVRQGVANTTSNWPNAAGRSKSLSSPVTYAMATGVWGVLTHYALYTAATGGTMLASGSLSVAQTVSSGDTVTIPPNALVVTVI